MIAEEAVMKVFLLGEAYLHCARIPYPPPPRKVTGSGKLSEMTSETVTASLTRTDS